MRIFLNTVATDYLRKTCKPTLRFYVHSVHPHNEEMGQEPFIWSIAHGSLRVVLMPLACGCVSLTVQVGVAHDAQCLCAVVFN